MKTIKKLLLNVMLMTFMLVMGSMTVSAATTTQNLGQNKLVSTSANGSAVYYKITVPRDGYITVSINNPKKESAYVYIYDKNKQILDTSVYTKATSASIQYPVAKGTYYLKGSSYLTYKFKYKFTKAVNKNNYSLAKATKLKKNATVTVVQTPQNNYDRWYKITLTKKQKVTMTVGRKGYIDLYDADYEAIDLKEKKSDDYATYTTKSALKKGTYYVRVKTYGSLKYACMYTLKWK